VRSMPSTSTYPLPLHPPLEIAHGLGALTPLQGFVDVDSQEAQTAGGLIGYHAAVATTAISDCRDKNYVSVCRKVGSASSPRTEIGYMWSSRIEIPQVTIMVLSSPRNISLMGRSAYPYIYRISP
jgi:hypothetical protein